MACLEGKLVIAIEQAVAAPLCTARLADAGARVIKIERADGDFARRYDAAAKGESSYFAWLNQGKESVCLDFKTDADAAVLWSLIKKADILIQNLSPGALARAGFSQQQLHAVNDQLIICNVSGYGNSAEVADKRAYDLLVQAESGLISVSGSSKEPGRIGVSICDIGTGITAYAAILEALINRSVTGKGEELSVSLFDVSAEWMTVPYLHAVYGEGAPKPVGLQHPSIAPYGAFECKDDRLVLISIQNEREWRRLCTDVLLNDALLTDNRFRSNNARVSNRAQLEKAISAVTSTLTAGEFQHRLQRANIAFGVINSAADLPHHVALRTRSVSTASGKTMQVPAHPVQHGNNKTLNAARTPLIGEHTASVKQEFDPVND